MVKTKIKIGDKYGMLTVLSREPNDKSGTRWKCLCECGNETIVRGSNLLSGCIKSCGCKRKSMRITHGMTNTRLYHIWANMIQRCTNPNKPDYKYYGGRGITICDEWISSFQKFAEWAKDNNYDDTLTIDRINVNKGYYPDNCKWATKKEQANNTRTNCNITVNGITKTASEWSIETGESASVISERIRKGYKPEDAIKKHDFRKENLGNQNLVAVVNITKKEWFPSIKIASEYYHVNSGNISHACKNHNHKAANCFWMKYGDYIQEYGNNEDLQCIMNKGGAAC